MHEDSATTGMRNEGRFGGGGDAFRRRLRVRMTEIDGHAELVHFRNRFPAELGQAIGLPVETTDSERRPPVISELHHADTEPTEQLDPLDLVLEHVCGLE